MVIGVRISELDEQANFISGAQLQYRDRADFADRLLFAVLSRHGVRWSE
jgi:hypothetical protein